MKTLIRNRVSFFAVIVTLALTISACGGQPASQQTAPDTSGNAPAAAQPQPGSASALSNFIASDPAIVRNTGRPQVVEFFAFWCTTCQGMRPTVHELQDQYGKQVDFVYLDIDAENTKQLQKDLTFTGLRPTIVFLSADGVEISRTVGVQNKETLTERIEALLTGG